MRRRFPNVPEAELSSFGARRIVVGSVADHPIALSQESAVGLGTAVVSRISSFVINCGGAAIVGLLGWLAGKMILEATGIKLEDVAVLCW